MEVMADEESRKLGSEEAWRDAMAMFASDASIPTVLAPSRAKLWKTRRE
jgi:hypothetical protein